MMTNYLYPRHQVIPPEVNGVCLVYFCGPNTEPQEVPHGCQGLYVYIWTNNKSLGRPHFEFCLLVA